MKTEKSTAAIPIEPPTWHKDTILHEWMPRFQSDFRQRLHNERIPGAAVVIVKGDEIVWEAAFGYKDAATGDSLDLHTPFRLASLSKGFAPVLVQKLVDQGMLDWDEPILTYCPDLPFIDSLSRQITLRHLLSQSSGYPHHTFSNLLNMDEPYERIRPLLAEVPLAHPPGTFYNYQNVLYGICGEVVERQSGRSYDELLEELVLQPLGMQASSGRPQAGKEEELAQPHGPDSNGYHRVPFTGKYYTVSPAAGVNAGIHDMGIWLQALLGAYPQVIDPELASELFRIQIPFIGYEPSVKQWRPYERAGYGLGWRVIEYADGRRIITHSGYVNGYRAELAFSPGDELGICMLSNGSNGWFHRAPVHFFAEYWNLNIGNPGH